MILYTKRWFDYLTKPAKFGGLDLLRAFAIMMVISWHLNNNLVPFGWSGVDLFFILSGFLIYSIYKNNSEKISSP